MDKQMKLNKICFGLGTVGRDALYSLVSMYLLVHLTDVVRFSDGGLAAIGVILTCFGIFDAVIDPFVGAIVGNTKTSFFIDGTTILAQKTGNTTIPFYYDGNGKRIAFKYGGSMYFYVYNLRYTFDAIPSLSA